MDINLFRVDKGGNPDLIRESQRRRYAKVELVDEVIALDRTWVSKLVELEKAQKEVNQLSKQVGELKKKKENADHIIAQSKALQEKIAALELEEKKAKEELDKTLYQIGNFVHESVPVSNDEANNQIVRTWGDSSARAGALKHYEILPMIEGYDLERGVKVAGQRGYFLKNVGVALNQAIIQYALQFLFKRQYNMLQTPFMMNKDIMGRVAQLSEFDEALYKVQGSGETEQYLIATSEQPIAAFHVDEHIDPKDLPIRYAGFSSCFRKEAGSHGKDVRGIFRVHQFEKVEQFVVTSPEKSWEMHEEMIKTSEEFYQSLNIPYRVVTIVSGELNNAAAKKYDLEGYFPGFNEFRELVSCSNCTDYQARRMETRFGMKKQGEREKKYVHMLNSTLAATGRTLCAILENNQTEKGINVPKPLQPFLGVFLEDPTFIPFVAEKPKETTPAPAKKAGK
eukprot:TRINITY_DN13346_c0_g1_i1.p1 TRINITY_DN13346_c0_g1~~TRINITY_DN13346_c0_g1_i1.p1  ORF type:complete len:462 (+),score=161.78 TRINITY_DN13346_c0_g1_i1:28-1386(+)